MWITVVFSLEDLIIWLIIELLCACFKSCCVCAAGHPKKPTPSIQHWVCQLHGISTRSQSLSIYNDKRSNSLMHWKVIAGLLAVLTILALLLCNLVRASEVSDFFIYSFGRKCRDCMVRCCSKLLLMELFWVMQEKSFTTRFVQWHDLIGSLLQKPKCLCILNTCLIYWREVLVQQFLKGCVQYISSDSLVDLDNHNTVESVKSQMRSLLLATSCYHIPQSCIIARSICCNGEGLFTLQVKLQRRDCWATLIYKITEKQST